MISLTLLALALNPTAGPRLELVQIERTADLAASDGPIRLWLDNGRQYREGDRARAQVESRDDGYLIVFNYDTEGRLRVLFPVDPGDDNFVRGGRRYEIRGRGDRESFLVGRDGVGLVYAAVSADPFRFGGLEQAGNWDYARVSIPERSSDPEADITDLLESMASNRGFDYDVVQYQVYGVTRRYIVANMWDPYWDDYYCHPYYRPSLFGCRPYGGWYFGVGYSPYRYGYYGYPYRYGYRYPVYYGGGSVRRNYPVVVGRPRSYTIVRQGNPPSSRVGSRPGSSVGNPRPMPSRPRDASRPRPQARPSNDRPAASPSTGERPRQPDAARPRGRRSTAPAAIPTIERERAGGRPSVDLTDRRETGRPSESEGRARRAAPRDDSPRVERSEPRSETPRRVDPSEPRADGPRRVERSEPRTESPRVERAPDRPRGEGRPSSSAQDAPRREAPRAEAPRRQEAPRAQSAPQRSSPPPSAAPARSGGNDRGSSSSSPRRPRGG
ncbi:MAG: DUF4384 domain-containing protein [Gemmatimonadales bacterium]|nr:DUF4384 domain-containing protein [Gemmatimonadales bacterium]